MLTNSISSRLDTVGGDVHCVWFGFDSQDYTTCAYNLQRIIMEPLFGGYYSRDICVDGVWALPAWR